MAAKSDSKASATAPDDTATKASVDLLIAKLNTHIAQAQETEAKLALEEERLKLMRMDVLAARIDLQGMRNAIVALTKSAKGMDGLEWLSLEKRLNRSLLKLKAVKQQP